MKPSTQKGAVVGSIADLNTNDKEKLARIVRDLIAEKKLNEELSTLHSNLQVQYASELEKWKLQESNLLNTIDTLQLQLQEVSKRFSQEEDQMRLRVEELTAKYAMSMGLLKLYQTKLSSFATFSRIADIKISETEMRCKACCTENEQLQLLIDSQRRTIESLERASVRDATYAVPRMETTVSAATSQAGGVDVGDVSVLSGVILSPDRQSAKPQTQSQTQAQTSNNTSNNTARPAPAASGVSYLNKDASASTTATTPADVTYNKQNDEESHQWLALTARSPYLPPKLPPPSAEQSLVKTDVSSLVANNYQALHYFQPPSPPAGGTSSVSLDAITPGPGQAHGLTPRPAAELPAGNTRPSGSALTGRGQGHLATGTPQDKPPIESQAVSGSQSPTTTPTSRVVVSFASRSEASRERITPHKQLATSRSTASHIRTPKNRRLESNRHLGEPGLNVDAAKTPKTGSPIIITPMRRKEEAKSKNHKSGRMSLRQTGANDVMAIEQAILQATAVEYVPKRSTPKTTTSTTPIRSESQAATIPNSKEATNSQAPATSPQVPTTTTHHPRGKPHHLTEDIGVQGRYSKDLFDLLTSMEGSGIS